MASQDESDVASQDESDAASQDESDAASQDESDAASQDESDAASQDESDAASQDESDAASQDESDAASQDESDAASQDESDVASQDESDESSYDESVTDYTPQVDHEGKICIPELDDLLARTLSTGKFKSMQEVLDHVLVKSVKSPSSSITSIRYYLSRGAGVYSRDAYDQDAMHLAVRRGDYDIIKLFVEYGADACYLDEDLYKNIIQQDRMDILRLLFSSCVDDVKIEMLKIIQHDNFGTYNPLYWAFHYRKIHIIKFLIDEGMDVDLFVDNREGYNLLHHAAAQGDEELVDLLLGLGASVYRFTNYAEHLLPFQIAVNNGHSYLASKLVPEDINAPDPKPRKWLQFEEIDNSGFTMLMYACYASADVSAKNLIKNGADPNKAVHGILPLQIAIWNRQQEIIDYLYPLTDMSLIKWQKDHLVEAIYNCLDVKQFYPDRENATMGGKPLLTYLLEANVEVNQTIEKMDAASILMTACETGNAEHVKILLDHGLEPNIQCECSATNGLCNILYCAVVYAARKGHRLKVLKNLLQANPDVHYLSSIKVKLNRIPRWSEKLTTPAQEALFSEKGELITLCLEAGCCLYDTKVILDAVKDSIEPPLQPHIIELIDKYDSSPRSLQHLSKFAVRRCLGHQDVNARIDSLPLPKHVKDYVKYVGF